MRLFDKMACGVLRDPVSAISGGIGLVGNLASGLIGSSAAKKAAAGQAAAAAAAGQKVTDATAAANPAILDAAKTGASYATDTAHQGANDAITTASQGAANVKTAAEQANAGLDQFATTGRNASAALDTGLAKGGEFNHAPTMADIQIDPGYAFRLQQGEKALAQRGAGQGGYFSGAALKDLNNYVQGSASQEYASAFNRYQTDTASRYDRLFGASNAGQAAATTQGGNTIGANEFGAGLNENAQQFGAGLNENSAQYGGSLNYTGANQVASNTIGAAKTAADYLTQGANASAAGTVGAANAWGSALTGGANAVGGALTLSQLLKNPALLKPMGPPALPGMRG